MKCRKCGGEKKPREKCKLCDLFAQGTRQFVEVERLNNPKISVALGTSVKQMHKQAEFLRKNGVPTDYIPEGQKFAGAMIIKSRAHQKRVCKVLGLHNNDGGYGD